MNSILGAALEYAARDWFVFPVAAGGKVPAIAKSAGGNGHKGATADADQIQSWWGSHPDWNIGIACEPSGLFVLDVDPAAGGSDSLKRLCDDHGEDWLQTPTVLTARGGAHYYFSMDAGLESPQSKVGIRPGLDIRCRGGYVVAPPSARPQGSYRWAPNRGLEECALRPLPSWLMELTRTVAVSQHLASPDAFSEGQRNSQLLSLAGSMRRRGMGEASILAALMEENAARCRPPLLEDEVGAITQSVMRYPPALRHHSAQASDLFSLSSLISQPLARIGWPEPPGADAFLGLAGDVVSSVSPHTEADEVAVLGSFLTAFGNAVGAGPHFIVGATTHFPREFMAIVGKSSKARKGDSWQPVRSLFSLADADWTSRVGSGLSTGEGLIYAVRDYVEKQEPIKERGRIVEYQTVVADPGVEDKRLLVMESELAKVLRVMERQGNSLSPTLRSAWDTGTLRTMTKASPLVATGAHISLIGHITVEELSRELPDVEAANGFGNRFLWVAAKRSKLLPDPEPFTGTVLHQLAGRVEDALARARRVSTMVRDEVAGQLWRDVYADLALERDGLAGGLLGRAEAHVLRLSMIYALLEGSGLIRLEHLSAALELWGYVERSVAHIFGDAIGDPVADAVLNALRQNGSMTRTDISALFGRHENAGRISGGLQRLITSGKAAMSHQDTGGRPIEIWRATA